LSHGVGRLRGIRQRRSEQHQDLVLKNQLFEYVDGLLFFTLLVLDHQFEFLAIDAASAVNLTCRKFEALADRYAVLRGVTR